MKIQFLEYLKEPCRICGKMETDEVYCVEGYGSEDKVFCVQMKKYTTPSFVYNPADDAA